MKPYFAKYLPVEGEIKKGDEVSFTIRGKSLKKPVAYFKYPSGDKKQPFSCVVVNLRKDEFMEGPFPIRYFGGDHWADEIVEIELKRNRIGLAKLFLCSRDIQVGDKVLCPMPYQNNKLEEFQVIEKPESYNLNMLVGVFSDDREMKEPAYLGQPFKVIGEISPGALWVKEGDEFTIDMLAQYNDGKPGTPGVYLLEEEELKWMNPKKLIVLIKCPTCGKFH